MKTLEGKLDKFLDNATNYFTKITDREAYRYVNIMEYINDGYVITNKISEQNLREMIISREAVKQGVSISDELIRKIISSQPEFMDASGRFSPESGIA